jgi:ABC-2 type transport system ATP-binding protein
MAVIVAKKVSICYITGDFKDIGIKEYVLRHIKGRYNVKQFWADKDISFSLEKGDMLGIIGTNGAGKSTLLKAISGIMVPTEGKIQTKGTIAALLELTSGFDKELTVRENTYLRGALLGYTRKFMDFMYEDIIDFAELRDFQDHMFKQLSSGMKSRLAFSIACLVNPEIIILDEVLSVGDGAFRKKSSKKMQEILSSGVTGILVSHSIGQVREMCNKILWLDHGKQIIFDDDVQMCCNAYEQFIEAKQLPKNREEAVALSEQYKKEVEAKAILGLDSDESATYMEDNE